MSLYTRWACSWSGWGHYPTQWQEDKVLEQRSKTCEDIGRLVMSNALAAQFRVEYELESCLLAWHFSSTISDRS